ncbi:MAG: ATP-binding cassette domain-containing protein, partial [Rickettsiales bacterium]
LGQVTFIAASVHIRNSSVGSTLRADRPTGKNGGAKPESSSAQSGGARSIRSGPTVDEETATSVVQFENVGVRYGTGPEVLSDITFELPDSSFHFVTGPSGAGKSSLLKLMYLALRPSRGLISLFGRNAAGIERDELPMIRRQIGVVFQNFRLIDHLSTFDNVALPLRVAGAAESMIQKHVEELLRWVGL